MDPYTLCPPPPPPQERVVSVILSLVYFCSFNTLMCQRENLMPMGRNSGHSPWQSLLWFMGSLWKWGSEPKFVGLQGIAFGVLKEKGPWLEISESSRVMIYIPGSSKRKWLGT